MSVTRWTDKKCTNIETSLNTFINCNDKKKYETKLMVISDIETRQVLKSNKTITIRDKKIEFNIIRYSYNQIIKDNSQNPLPIEDRTTKKSGYVIVYSDKTIADSPVKYIINRNSDALRILRLLLNYSGKSEVTNNQPILQSDMFIWLIKRIYYGENNIDIEDGTQTLTIDNLTEFKGQTEDATNRVAANGDSIMKILSTLSFLLESNDIKQIKFSLTYENDEDCEDIVLVFSKNFISTYVKNYSGSFEDDRFSTLNKEDSDLVIESEIYLLCYLAIIPEITQAYTESVDEKKWNSEIHKDFLEKVAKDLQCKIKQRITQITR